MPANDLPPQIKDLEGVFTSVVQSAMAFAGIVLFVVLVVGGLKYLTSGGDPKNIDSAQKTITYGLGGLILILLSYMILRFLQTITGVDLTNFRLTQ